MKKTKLWMTLSLAVVLVLSACGQNGGDGKNAGSNNDGTKTVGEQVKHEIIGIDPGAGIMKATAAAIEEYGLSDWKLVEGSGAAMTATLAKAIKNEEPIIITGWTPHWMFSKYDLKYLEDPKKTYGEAEEIHTLARKNLKDDQPEAYQFLENFKWTSDEMGEIMTAIQEGKSPEDAAKEWADSHSDRIDEWTKDIQPVSGKDFKLSYVAWDSEIASTHLVKHVLETKLGYKVTALQVEAGPMWTGVANGDVDATVAAWLPLTHADYWDKYKDQLEDLGANMEGVKTGLVVPSYMDISSIEDLKTK
ncbi:glycine betaine ABC transporter substrate-binding protein [Paenibacillus sp. DMB20]|uniref:glycine betaine ABC transporter substrate-binding protein n=1 Tax=Paenibacillus sp. DMB20 TaxID=1642570 RepID=UPI00062753A0|nr:glycine betaine ABC transporter substrate-binding protein [Paenibacillus sp. DMB20]KKO51079.1 glycine/betaine ABC transporter [Paenibacillus sp. DMB20]